MKNTLKLLVIILIAISLNKCYVVKQGIGQIEIIAKSRDFDKILADPKVDEKIKNKIRLVKEVKMFAKEKVGLVTNESYNTYIQLNSKYVAYNLSAAQPDKLEPIYWSFPIIGKVPYLGFFEKKDAIEERNKLLEKKLDTLLRGVRAYSTLGFFEDPLFSSIAELGDPTLINIVIHEMTHNTVFIKNNVNFNESLASFVGDKATILFIKERKKEKQIWIENINKKKYDKKIFTAFVNDLKNKVIKLYSEKITRNEKIQRRQEIFEEYKKIFKNKIKAKLKTKTYLFFEEIKLNNAIILSFQRYNSLIPLFEKLFKQMDSSLKKTLVFIKEIPSNKNPSEYITKKLLKQNKN